MSVMEHSRHNAKWTSGIHSDKFPVFYSVLIRINLNPNRKFKGKRVGIGSKFMNFRVEKGNLGSEMERTLKPQT